MYVLREMIRATGGDSSELRWRSTALGFAIRALDRLGLGGTHTLESHLQRFVPAIEADCFEVYFDEFARYVGHIVWETIHVPLELTGEASGVGEERGRYADAAVRIIGLMAPFGDIREMLGAWAEYQSRQNRCVEYVRAKGHMRRTRRVSSTTVSHFARRYLCRAISHVDHLHRPGEIAHLAKGSVARAHNLGRALLALHGSAWARRPLHEVMHALGPPLALEQYKVLCGASGLPEGVITWGWLSETTLREAPKRPIWQLHAGEWNEGAHLCLCGWAFRSSLAEQVRTLIMRDWFADEPEVVTYPSNPSDGTRTMRVWKRSERAALASWLVRPSLAHG